MNIENLEATVNNIDLRLGRVEQILPSLATKADLTTLAAKDELREAVAKLATKEELREAVAKLATKEELREESERTRHHAQVLYESLHHDISLVAEHMLLLGQRFDGTLREHRLELDDHDLRLVRLEAGKPPRT